MKTLVSTSNKKIVTTRVTFDEHEIREALMAHFAYELQDHACLGGPDLELYEEWAENMGDYDNEARPQFAEFIYTREEYVMDFI